MAESSSDVFAAPVAKRLKQNRLNRYFSQSEEANSSGISTPTSDQESAEVEEAETQEGRASKCVYSYTMTFSLVDSYLSISESLIVREFCCH